MLFDPVAAGHAIVFICLLVALIVVSAGVLAYNAHCLRVVVESTAAGIDRVRWPSEVFTEWVGQGVHVAFLLCVSLFPAGLIARAVRLPFLPSEPGLRFAVGALAAFWLLFPLFLLSSMSAGSQWLIVHPPLFLRLLRRPVAVLAFYAVTGPLLAAAAAPWYGVFGAGHLWLLPVAALAGATVLLVYGRLLGRLAWVAQHTAAAKPERPVKKRRRRPRGVEAHDPWGVPEPEAPARPPEPAERRTARRVKGYRLAKEEPPRAPEPPPASKSAAPAPPTPEEELYRSDDAEPPPARPLVSGVYTFPWYDTSLPHWLMLALSHLAVGGLGHLVLLNRPF